MGQVFQNQDHGDAKHNHLIAATRADEQWQQHLELVVKELINPRPNHRSPKIAHPPQHRHEEVLNAHFQTEI